MLPPTAPVVVVEDNHGGIVADFAARIADYRRHHVTVIIRGECDSSCTMLLSLRRVCADGDVTFGFHRAFHQDPANPYDMSRPAPEGTRIMLRHYPARIRSWIAAHGGLTSELLTLSGAEMSAVVPACR